MPRLARPCFCTRVFWTDRAAWTARLYNLQHRLAITRTEATAFLALTGLLSLGLGVRAWQTHQVPFDDAFYAETDATFAALAQASPTEPIAAPHPDAIPSGTPDSTRTSGQTSEQKAEHAGEPEPVAEASPPPTPRSTRVAAGPVRMNLNTANARLLDRLPGIGPALAERILTYRTEHGDFARPEDLVNVRGIGPKTFERIAPYVFVEQPADAEEPTSADAIAANTDSPAHDDGD
ncbi:MAG: helix-hairpin-helix domain-containing protein [Bacteroidota bacterium]